MLFYGKQSISETDIEAVTKVLRSDFLTQGPMVEEFEDALCEYTGARYAVAVSSGTAALHLAVLASGLHPGDEAVTSPNTFLASANCIRYAGATVRFADIESDTANISPAEIEKQISPRTKLLIPVHFGGQSCDMQSIRAIADRYNLKIIEDAAHAIGSEYQGRKVGSCIYSDMTIFSFHPVKNITTGEGGAIMTNNPDLYETLKMLRSHGTTKDPKQLIRNDGPWYYEMQTMGFNYRLTDLQAALGISQLKRLETFKRIRRSLMDCYRLNLENIAGISMLSERAFSDACFHLCPLLFNFDFLHLDKCDFFEKMKKNGIILQVHYIPVHTQPYYQSLGFRQGDFPNAEKYYHQEFTFPLNHDLSNATVMNIVNKIKRIISNRNSI